MDKMLYHIIGHDHKFSAFNLITEIEIREKLFDEAVCFAKESRREDLIWTDLVMEYYTRLVKLYIAIHPKNEFREFLKDHSDLLD